MRDVTVIGAGRIGAFVAELLATGGGYRVTVADRDEAALDRLPPAPTVARRHVDVEAPEELRALLSGQYAVLSAAPYFLTTRIADAALAAGCHYLDLTEDVGSTRYVRAIAEGASTAFVPQCGLAPGFVSIAAHDLAGRFDRLDTLRLAVGALPLYPTNGLDYNLTWSTDGVINEYCEPCEAIVDGARRDVAALEDREEFSLDGVRYEAFNTSGGLGTLCETFAGRVRHLSYRTVRYPGHAAVMKLLLNDLRLRDRRPLFKDLLEFAVPATLQDVVIVHVSATGTIDGRLMQETFLRKIHGGTVNGRTRSAIQTTTASGICTALDLLAAGALRGAGFVRQEEIPLASFLANRFGRVYGGAADPRAEADAALAAAAPHRARS